MPNPGSIIGQITEELGELGKKVAAETVKAPKDIAGKALESLGTSSGKTQQGSKMQPPPGQATEKPTVDEFGKTDDEKIKREIARRALEELSGKKQPKELSVWEKIQKEEEEKKEREKKKKEEAAKAALPKSTAKRPRGDLYGIKAKKGAAEMSRNVRQD